jgi:hypothetical protein
MANWTKILPYFFIEWYAQRYCEVIHTNTFNVRVVRPFNDMYIKYKGIKEQE